MLYRIPRTLLEVIDNVKLYSYRDAIRSAESAGIGFARWGCKGVERPWAEIRKRTIIYKPLDDSTVCLSVEISSGSPPHHSSSRIVSNHTSALSSPTPPGDRESKPSLPQKSPLNASPSSSSLPLAWTYSTLKLKSSPTKISPLILPYPSFSLTSAFDQSTVALKRFSSKWERRRCVANVRFQATI